MLLGPVRSIGRPRGAGGIDTAQVHINYSR